MVYLVGVCAGEQMFPVSLTLDLFLVTLENSVSKQNLMVVGLGLQILRKFF